MEQQRLQYLLEQYVNDKATAAEIQELEQYDLQSEENLALLADLMADGFAQQPAETEWAEEARFSGLAQKALQVDKAQALPRPAARPVHRIHFLRRWGWAAAAALLIAGAVIYNYNKPAGKNMLAAKHPVKTDIGPGQQGAILTLADNTQVLLDTIKNGVVALQGGAIARVVNGTLHYEGTGTNQVFNTMYTPKGRQYHLTLPDGTQVWLNAASSLKFPTAFSGKERDVELNGEAYFEVTKNKAMPFHVASAGQHIEVLGTHFDINSYRDEAALTTTLLEGSVKVTKGALSAVLRPGQQSAISNNETNAAIKVSEVNDVEEVTAWKDGKFHFNDTDIKTVLRQVSRWYNVDIEYQGKISADDVFTGTFSRDMTAAKALKLLEFSGVNFKIEGRKIIVK